MEKAPTLGTPRLGALPLSGRSLPVYFRLADRTRSVFRGPPAGTRDTQYLSRLRAAATKSNRDHDVFRYTREHPVAIVNQSSWCLTGRATSSAGTQCLSRLRRSLRKQTAIGLFCAPRRKSYESSYAIVTAQCFTGRTASFRAYGVP